MTDNRLLPRPWRAILPAAMLLAAAGTLAAQQAPRTVHLAARSTKGDVVKVPAADRTTVLLFLRIGQPQSNQALQAAKKDVAGGPPVQVVVIVSGKQDPAQLRKFYQTLAWPVVSDEDYQIIGKLGVHVWPTTLVVLKDAKELARLPGLAESYQNDLGAYLAFAAGKINQAELKRELGSQFTVADSPHQMAMLHLQVARRLLARDLVNQARAELERGLKLAPHEGRLQLTMARVLLMLGQPQKALKLLDQITQPTVRPEAINTLKGGAMVLLGRWDDAVRTLQTAVRLNPDPAEAYYYLGVAYQQEGKSIQAAGAFRAAFEATPMGQHLGLPTLPSGLPASRPAAER